MKPLYRIPLSRPAYFGNEEAYVADAIHRRELSMGDYVAQFEAACADYLQVRYAVAVASGTVGLHLAGLTEMWEYGEDDIVTTPLTYVASANAIRYCGCMPRFGDVDPGTWTLTKPPVTDVIALLMVDLYGLPAPQAIAPMHDTIYDACESFGATIGERPLTVRGGLHVFSFYGNKVITCGEGGLVTTDDATQYDHLLSLRGQGQHPTRRYWHEEVGYNYRMTNLQGALGLAQLETIDEHLTRRTAVIGQYHWRLRGSGITWQIPPAGVVPAPWLFACRLPEGVDRDAVMASLTAQGIETRPVFPCLHLMPAHRTGESFPVAEAISASGVCLPTFAELTEGEVDEVCDAVLKEIVR